MLLHITIFRKMSKKIKFIRREMIYWKKKRFLNVNVNVNYYNGHFLYLILRYSFDFYKFLKSNIFKIM
jgi:hypothetical protein